MIVYEVTLTVQRRVERDYRAWLDAHVRAILALPGFVGATVFERDDPPPPADAFVVCVHYRLTGPAAFADYLREHAPRMRADGLARFGDAFRAERRLLTPLADY